MVSIYIAFVRGSDPDSNCVGVLDVFRSTCDKTKTMSRDSAGTGLQRSQVGGREAALHTQRTRGWKLERLPSRGPEGFGGVVVPPSFPCHSLTLNPAGVLGDTSPRLGEPLVASMLVGRRGLFL